MSTAENKRLMQEIFAELAEGNSAALVDALADDVVWHVTGTTKFSRSYKGKTSLMTDLVAPLFAALEGEYKNLADRFIADESHVVVECRGISTTKQGRPYNNKYCFVFRIEAGKIQEVTEYMDTDLVVKTFGD